MTTEIAILNRSAVALAADSAVSVSANGGLKVYDGVNKLFELVKGRPVGVMIYNAAELSFRPWETIIKIYREERRDHSFPTLDDYVSDFKGFIRDHKELFSQRQQDEALTQTIASDLAHIRTSIAQELRAAIHDDKPSDREVALVTGREIRGYWQWARSEYVLDRWGESLPSARILGKQLKSQMDALINELFENLPVTDSLRSKLRIGLIHRTFGYNVQDGEFSGVVFAGFGDNEYYPRLREFRTKGMYANQLLCHDVAESRTDIGVTVPGDIRSFAQGDMIRSFTAGIQDQVRAEMIRFWDQWRYSDVGHSVSRDPRLNHLGRPDKTAVATTVNSFSEAVVTDFFKHMASYERASVRGPLLQSVAFLPKDELGAMAESLVNLTTLKRRVSINEAQTVGGAVDVAVVSRGDGFVWLKRKHYFDQSLNPSWAMTHAAMPAVPREVSSDG